MSLNKATLIGRVGKDPEIRTTQEGKEIANFSLATSERWKDKNTGEKKEKTEWHKIVVFNQALITIIKSYIKKGSHIYVEGAIHTRKWQDKEDRDIYSTEIVLQAFNGVIQLLDSKKESRPESNGYNSYESANTPGKEVTANNDFTEVDDEIPF